MPARSAFAVETRGLAKAFGATRAVDGVDLMVPLASIYGLLGPNGAGKTTVIRMLATLTLPDAGRAHVLGYDLVGEVDAIRSRVSLMGQFASVDEDLTGWENLVLLEGCWATGVPRPRRGRTNYSTRSASATPPTGRSTNTPAVCDADSTLPRAS